MAGAGGDEVVDGVNGLDAAAGADGGAVESGGGASEVKLSLQGPALQEAVDEASVENVSSAGGVNGLDAKRSGVMELLPVPGQNPLFAECRGGEAGAESFFQGREGLPQIRFSCQAARNVPAGNEKIDVDQQCFDPGVKIVHIGDDGYSGRARPGSCGSRGGGIVSIDVKSAGIQDPLFVQFFRAQGEAVVAFPKDGALAEVVHKNKGLLAGTAGRGEEMRFDAQARKFRAVKSGGAVVTDLADVARAQSPLLARHHGSGDLPARQDFRGAKFDFGAARGIVSDGNERIRGVQAHADDIELG